MNRKILAKSLFIALLSSTLFAAEAGQNIAARGGGERGGGEHGEEHHEQFNRNAQDMHHGEQGDMGVHNHDQMNRSQFNHEGEAYRSGYNHGENNAAWQNAAGSQPVIVEPDVIQEPPAGVPNPGMSN